ncbi:hypothetical protein [uncultured Bradyrhizobium sp.]|uniref:hypothetical protein n=1 Tax=Bradyrhizobium sp. TaxID=376 RepID=UPI0026308F41|nr:hypothetical protein [uncultured Bradyrhizobium sp.]
MTIRLLNTNNVPATGINPPGNPMNAKSYGIAPGGFLDVVGVDEAATLLGQRNGLAGFFQVGTSGPATSRPVNVTPGAIHIDTTLSKVVTFDGSSWRDPVTGAVV